jgi:predicted ATPase/DNA-binding winged helix-turn-helix (wHTH) protein
MDADSGSKMRLAFRRFLLLPHRREVLADGKPIRLGARAFDLLLALIEARGEVVSKDALMTRVWFGQVVEENSLQSHISDLRTALGPDRDLIRTVSSRGYQFTGEVRVISASTDENNVERGVEHPSVPPPSNLPASGSELIGRDEILGEILGLASTHRLVTLTGVGGIGKTRLALAAAQRMLPEFPDGVWLADFSPLADPALVPTTVAAATGIDLGGDVSPQRLAQALAGRRMLLVLDTCEHVIAATAALADAVVRTSRGVRLLATSREPLEVEAEWVCPVPPLSFPAKDAEDADLMRFAAVRLFFERARAANPGFAPAQRLLVSIAAICRQLDGIPLAIEMVAARASAFPVEEIMALLDDRLRLLTARRRTSLSRHQTLRATLDWSHDLLTDPERAVLRRLAIFAGAFSLEAAGAVVANPPELERWTAVDVLSSLVAKSLVVADVGDGGMPYRLLDTTRAYALEKLEEGGERGILARRHAAYFRNLLEHGEAAADSQPAADWVAAYGRTTDNLRAALDWAFSPSGDPSIGVALTVAAVPLWMQSSLVEECRRRVEQSLEFIAAGAEADARHEMKLHAALGATLMYTRGGGSEIGSAWNKALEIAERLGDTAYQLRALWGLWSFHGNGVQHRTALTLAHRYRSLAATSADPNHRAAAQRMIGVSHHYLGEQESARRHIELALVQSAAPDRERRIIGLQLDLRVTTRVHLARVLWLQGLPDQAMREAELGIEDAREAKHEVSFSYALARAACPVALWTGDLAAADRYTDMLLEHAKRHALPHWHLYGRGYQAAIAIMLGDVETGLRLLNAHSEDLSAISLTAPRLMRFAAIYLAEALGRAGQIDEGLAAIEDAIARARSTAELWQFPEWLRLKGELILARKTRDAATEAEAAFREAIDWARRQGALSWELRAAMSLARLLRDQGGLGEAAGLLQPVFDRFTEGFETADLRAAGELLGALQPPDEA